MGFLGFNFSLDYSRLSDKQLRDLFSGSANELKARGLIQKWMFAYDPKNPQAKELFRERE